MDCFRKEKEDPLHITGYTYVSPYEVEREKEERDEEERTTRRASNKAWADRIDGLNRKSLDDLCGLHESLLLRAHARYTGQPVAPLEQTTDARVSYLRGKYSLDFWTALFEYITFKARTSRKHALLRPKVNGRGQSTGVTHSTDMDDYVQDLCIGMWEQVQKGDFRGVDEEGNRVNFLHYVNKCYDNCFNSAATKQFAADKISRKIHAKEMRQTDDKPENDETEDQAPKRSKGWSNESVSDGSRFSPDDPEKNERLKEIVDRLTRSNPQIAALLSQGLNKREICERLNIKYSRLTRLMKKVKDAVEAEGITARETGRVFRTPNKRATKPKAKAGAELEAVTVD